MIILQEELAQEFRKEVLESFCLLDIDFPVPVYLTETDNQVIHDEKIYVSRGFSFDNINSAPGLSVAEFDLLIDNTDHAFSSILLHGDQRGREVKISLGAVIGGTGPLVDGEVKTATRANTKISAVDGSAFVDFSESAYLTLPEHRGCKLTITDSAGKKLIGYIKAAGTGETLGANVLTNGDMESFTGWSQKSGALSAETTDKIEGAQSGKFTLTGGYGYGYFYRLPAWSLDCLYAIDGYIKNLTIDTMYIEVGPQGNPKVRPKRIFPNSVPPSTWTEFSAYYTPPSGSIFLSCGFGISGNAWLTDNVTIKQVLTPSATGVTITSTPDGSTFNWATKEDGFNCNDESGYTYQIERERSLLVQEFIRGFISSWELSSDNNVRISVKNEAMLWAKKTLRIHSSSCPWVFKGTECGYSGTATWCDKNYARCGELLNTDNYGGFRFLPSIMEKEIWWGKSRK